jgi:hypothetical protein
MKRIFCLLLLTLFCFACASTPKQGSNLTYGMVKKYVVKGETTEEEVLRIFGAPNIITKRAGKLETWTYEKVSYDTSSKRGGIGVGGGGPVGAGGIGGFGSFGASKSSSGTKTVTLMIYFDENEKVVDYSMMETHY